MVWYICLNVVNTYLLRFACLIHVWWCLIGIQLATHSERCILSFFDPSLLGLMENEIHMAKDTHQLTMTNDGFFDL